MVKFLYAILLLKFLDEKLKELVKLIWIFMCQVLLLKTLWKSKSLPLLFVSPRVVMS